MNILAIGTAEKLRPISRIWYETGKIAWFFFLQQNGQSGQYREGTFAACVVVVITVQLQNSSKEV